MLISTGSQGEPDVRTVADRRELRSRGADPARRHRRTGESPTPGNENSVYRVINGLTRHGANVVHKGNALVHVSGHASAGELLYCYNIVRPRNVMPMHGEIRHLHANAELALVALAPPADNVVVVEDSVVVDLVDRKATVAGKVDCGYVFVDGLDGRRHHRHLAQGPPDPRRRGVHLDHRGDGLGDRQADRGPRDPRLRVRRGRQRVRRGGSRRSRPRSTRRSARGVDDTYQLQQVIRRVVGKVGQRQAAVAGR